LNNCFGMPKLPYTLRCALCYGSTILSQYNAVIKQTLQVTLSSISVRFGALGLLVVCCRAIQPDSASTTKVPNTSLLVCKTYFISQHVSSGKLGATLLLRTQWDWAFLKAWDVPLVQKKLEEVMLHVGRASLRLVPECSPVLGGRHTSRRHIAVSRCHPSDRCPELCTSRESVEHRSTVMKYRANLRKVGWSSHAT